VEERGGDIMADRYLRKIIKRNWKTLVILILILIVTSFVVKNVSEIPYENRYMLNTTYPLEFELDGKDVRGFIYIEYWLKTKEGELDGMTENEIDNYLYEHGYIDLSKKEDQIISTLKTYSIEKIKENWSNDVEYILKNNSYFVSNDPILQKMIQEEDMNIDLSYEVKKALFVYMKKGEFGQHIEKIKKGNTNFKEIEDDTQN
jgi:hypothetical protein